MPTQREDTMQPEVIGNRYRVERAIGQGGMGTVWLCRDETLRREVAVKQVGLLPGETATDSARAFREARSSAALSHRNVVTIFDVVEEEGQIWLVMEYVAGRSLSQMIKQDGALDPAVVADIGAQVAAGLAAAQAAGTNHRDVKPGNILVTDDGVAKISDFGIARTAGDPALTQSGLVTGTPHYFSPELARGGEPGYANDVWALGATLYAAVEGRPPYRPSTNPVAVLHEIATQKPPRAERAAFLAPVLERMMDPDLASRWSMDDAAHVLGRLAVEHRPENTLRSTKPDGIAVAATALEPMHEAEPEPEPIRAQPPAEPPIAPRSDRTQPVRPAPRPAAVRKRRSRAVPVLVGLLAVLAAIAAVLVVRQLWDGGGQENPPASAGNNQKGDGQDSANKNSANQSSGGQSGSSSAAEKEQLVRDYYAAAPGGTDKAWAMLGPGMQEQGRERYDAFWRTIESVDVQSADVAQGSDSVQVTLIYHTSDGRTSTEHKVEGLVESDDGGYLIDSDEPAG
jgi:eukaryotic-like serine/threonine-protein kinase